MPPTLCYASTLVSVTERWLENLKAATAQIMKLSEKISNVKTEEHETQIRPETPLIITHLIQRRDIVLEVGSDTDNADERYAASD